MKLGEKFFLRPNQIGVACITGALMLVFTPVVARFSAHFATEPWCFYDDGNIAYTAYRASLGEFPHVAFPYFYSGGFEVLLALLFKLFGVSFGIAQWLLGATMALTAALMAYIFQRMGIDAMTAAMSSMLTTGAGVLMNYHLFPGWLAQASVLLGAVLFMKSQESGSAKLIILAGFCIGLAASFKQTYGIYGFLGLVMYATFYRTAEKPTSRAIVPWRSALFLNMGAVVVMCFIPILLFISVLRMHLNVLNAVMFLVVPAAFSVLIAWWFIRKCVRNPAESQLTASSLWKAIPLLVLGSILGFLPLAGLFALEGSFMSFISESFFQVQDVVSKRYVGFQFTDSMGGISGVLRRLIGFSLPLVAACLSFGLGFWRLKKNASDTISQSLILNGILLSVLYLTLYPNVNRAYVFFFLPLAAAPFISILENVLQRLSISTRFRSIIMLIVLLMPLAGYILSKQHSNDPEKRLAGEIVKIDDARGNLYVPRSVAENILPVINYLKSRNSEESFLGYDVYSKSMAFVAGRKVEINYMQKHHYGELENRDIAELIDAIHVKKVDTIVLGKSSLRDLPLEKELFKVLKEEYVLALENQNYFGFQRLNK